MQKRKAMIAAFALAFTMVAIAAALLFSNISSAQEFEDDDYTGAEKIKIIGAFTIKKGIDRVYVKWTGPDVKEVRWDWGDGEGMTGNETSHTYDMDSYFREPTNFEITAYGYAENNTIYWSNTTVTFEGTQELATISAANQKITITNASLFASSAVMIITGALHPDIHFLFKWNTGRVRILLGAIVMVLAVLLTPGVLPA